MKSKKVFYTQRVLQSISIMFLAFVLNSCASLLGIHNQLPNPDKPVTYPKFKKEKILLGELTPLRENFDVTFYDLDIFIDYTTKKLNGWVAIKAIAVTEIDSIQIDLHQRFKIEELRWENREGEELGYKRDERAVFLKLPKKLKEGEVFTVPPNQGGRNALTGLPAYLT